MNSGKTIFAQLMDFLPLYEFRKCVERYNGNYKVKSFSCWDQFLCLAFAQLTYRESLRDIRVGRDHQETAQSRPEPLHNSTDFERHPFRENPHFTGPFADQLQNIGGGQL